jgi:hypothetical protein
MKLSFIQFITLIFLSILNPLYAQNNKIQNLKSDDTKRFRFGYYLGLNSVGSKIEYYKSTYDRPFRLKVTPKPSFDVGLVADMRINEFLNIRFHPGVAFIERQIIFPFSEENSGLSTKLINRNIKSNYVRFPIGLKLNTKRINNLRPYVMGSFSYNINVNSDENNIEDNTSGTFRMKKNVYAWEMSLGTEIYLPFFKFTPSLHGFFALSNELTHDKDPQSIYTQDIESMRSRGIFLRFTFE